MYNIGIDLGGTNIAAGIVDENGQILIKHSVPTYKNVRQMKSLRIWHLLQKLIAESGLNIWEFSSVELVAPVQ
ncbi:MAG: ROK family protein [Hominilimicola sp.]